MRSASCPARRALSSCSPAGPAYRYSVSGSVTRSRRSPPSSTEHHCAASTRTVNSPGRPAPAASTIRAWPYWRSEMEPPGLKDAPAPGGDPCAQELASLRERLERSEQHTAVVLMRATRLAQVISVLGSQRDLETTVERIAMEVGELFFADMTLLILES